MTSLFSKPNTIVYLRRSGLIIAGRQIKPARLNFPAGVVQNLEIVNHRKFLGGCQAFFVDHQVKGKRILLVLDQSLVFEKQLSADSNETVDDFIAAIPFVAGQRACVQLNGAADLELYATNYELFDAVTQALAAAGTTKITAVTPAAAYHLAADVKLATAIEHFISDDLVRSQANFAASQPL